MVRFIVQALVTMVGLWLADALIAGVEFLSTGSLIAAAIILGIVNVADGFTVNLAGPLVVNLTAQTIAQVVQDADLPTAAPLNGGN